MTEVEFIKYFGDSLSHELEDAWMSQQDLADITGISTTTISRYANGTQMPSLKNVINISKALDCNILDLIDITEIIK